MSSSNSRNNIILEQDFFVFPRPTRDQCGILILYNPTDRPDLKIFKNCETSYLKMMALHYVIFNT